jgi:hypothetical protein
MAEGGCGNQESYWHDPETFLGAFYAPFVMERYTTAVLTNAASRETTGNDLLAFVDVESLPSNGDENDFERL